VTTEVVGATVASLVVVVSGAVSGGGAGVCFSLLPLVGVEGEVGTASVLAFSELASVSISLLVSVSMGWACVSVAGCSVVVVVLSGRSNAFGRTIFGLGTVLFNTKEDTFDSALLLLLFSVVLLGVVSVVVTGCEGVDCCAGEDCTMSVLLLFTTFTVPELLLGVCTLVVGFIDVGCCGVGVICCN